MSIKYRPSLNLAPSVAQVHDHAGQANWLVFVKRYFALRQQKRCREMSLEMIRQLPRYLQVDVGFRLKTNCDEYHQKHSFY